MDDHCLAGIQPAEHLDLRAKVAPQLHRPVMHAVLLIQNSHLLPAGASDHERRGGDLDGENLALEDELDLQVHPRPQRVLRVGHVHLREQRPRGGVQGVGCPRHLARVLLLRFQLDVDDGVLADLDARGEDLRDIH